MLHAFNETYYITLRDKNTFYEMVTPLQILAHIADAIGGLEVTDVVALLAELPTYWAAVPNVPQYVMRLKEAQRKADCANLPISGAWLAVLVTSSLLHANSFPTNHPTWDGKSKAEQMCI